MSNFLKKPEEIKQLTNIKGGCLASNKITIDGEKIGYAYREKPDAKFPGDSGWRFLAGQEDDKYLSDPKNFNAFEINTICNYDESILSILNSEINSAFVKKGDSFIRD